MYDNRYVIWGRMAWGVLRDYEVYEDTEKSVALDEVLRHDWRALDPRRGDRMILPKG